MRDIYDLGDRLLLVSTDRISAFDWVLPTAIPDKGRVLTQIAAFWFELLGEPNHLITTDVETMDLPPGADRGHAGRPLDPLPQDGGRADRVRGPRLSGRFGLEGISAQRHGLRHPAAAGPDRERPAAGADLHARHQGRRGPRREHLLRARWWTIVGRELAEELRRRSLRIFQRGSEYARQRGIIIADTKFEFGRVGGELLLIDEVLTPDSSRFWPADQYAPGRSQPSFDKQFVRDWLSSTAWDKNSPPPALPDDVVAKTRQKYVEAYERLTDREFVSGRQCMDAAARRSAACSAPQYRCR